MGKQDFKSSTRDNGERVGRIGPVRGGGQSLGSWPGKGSAALLSGHHL
jgi:hypothetical protein